VPPARCVAEGVSGSLAVRMSGAFQFLAGGAVLVPSRGEFAIEADLGKPRFAIGDEPAPDAPGYANPLVADRGDLPRDVVIAALRFADLVRHIARIREAVGVKLRPIPDRHEDVRPGAGLDGGGDPRLSVVGVDR